MMKQSTFFLKLFLFFLVFPFQFSIGQKVGLVLSGGGARGLAHIGVIKALEENHIPIDYVAGTSAGAIVGCMYAQGYSPAQMDSIVNTDDFISWATGILDENYSYYFRKKEDNASWMNLKFSLDSVIQTTLPTNLVNSVPIDFALMENTAGVIAKAKYNFDSLFVPFRCVAADIENKQTVVFRKGDLAQAVRASAAFPFYFKPILFEGKILYDGGMYNNFPADVLLSDFQPDMIIGVNAAGKNTPTTEGNIISQIRTMMTTPTNFSVICENGILIEPNTDQFGLFDFNKIREIINEGYQSTIAKINEIKNNVQARSTSEELRKKRIQFRSDLPPVLVDNITISGINSKQAYYVKQILKPGNTPIPLKRLKASYFQLVADQNVKSVYPILKYNDSTGFYDMSLRISQEKDLITQFGGNLASRQISEAFVAAQYNLWTTKSYSFNTNFYFGKLYTSGQAKIRMDAPSQTPYFLEAEATLNQYDFYTSSNAIFTDQKPSYILTSDYNFGLNFGLPVRNKGKIIVSADYVRVADDYYQAQNFLQSDTADETLFKAFTSTLLYERNTLNRKQYASQGTFLSMRFRYFVGNEYTIPGSTSVDRQQSEDFHQWIQARLVYDNYYKRRGVVKLGFYGECVFSNQPFFANYTATVLSSPAFQPLQETKTLYLPNFHAHNYLGAGSRNVISIRPNLDFRIEGYVFQPIREIVSTPDLKAEYSVRFLKRYFTASGGMVFHSPVGPVGMFVNYYDDRENPFSFLFHIGFIIFNGSAYN
jgi:NTE family protein